MARKTSRKQSITGTSSTATAHTPQATRTVIRKFHTFLKQEALLTSQNDIEKLEKVKAEISKLGGLEAYQNMSSVGQGKDRGGGTEKILIKWIPEYLPAHIGKGKGKANVELLEVGALKPDNYAPYPYVSNTPIDLRSRDPRIKQQDFFLLDQKLHSGKYDVISLSLVLNFVPDARDRGKMLRLAQLFLRPHTGLLYLVLPLPCTENSRYLDRARLRALLVALGFELVAEQCKPGGKLGYFLARAESIPPPSQDSQDGELHSKKTLREGGSRNNFAVLL